MHPYITELVAAERINSHHQEATAARRARAARRSPRLHTPHLGLLRSEGRWRKRAGHCQVSGPEPGRGIGRPPDAPTYSGSKLRREAHIAPDR
jgi:hypothetical protein